MGRVNRLAERRALRRAADLALLTSLGSPTSVRACGAADQDFEYTRFEPTETAAPVDHEPVTEPIPVAGVEDPVHDWPGVGEPAPSPSAERSRDLGYAPPLDFAVSTLRGRPWYRSKPAAAALVAAVLITAAGGGWLLFRGADTAVRPSSIEAPSSAAPTPTTAAPTAVSAPKASPAPPPPPPPPPQAESTYSPSQRQYSPRYREPSQEQKPRVDVTRAPMSVAPVPRPVPGSGSSTPGDAPDRNGGGRRRGCFGFC